MQGKPRDTPEVVRILIQKSREIMSLSDQTLYCRDCNSEFVFTIGEQEFYASHNLTNAPTRCPSCRAARKGQASGGYGGSRGSSPEPPPMYNAVFSYCCHEKRLSFPPRG